MSSKYVFHCVSLIWVDAWCCIKKLLITARGSLHCKVFCLPVKCAFQAERQKKENKMEPSFKEITIKNSISTNTQCFSSKSIWIISEHGDWLIPKDGWASSVFVYLITFIDHNIIISWFVAKSYCLGICNIVKKTWFNVKIQICFRVWPLDCWFPTYICLCFFKRTF